MSRRDLSLVLIDRDGVINRDSANYIRSPAEWIPLPGSLEAIARLTRAGVAVAVITNQSGVARGFFSEETLAEIHAAMSHSVEEAGGRIAAVFHCPHHPNDGCECRKPKPKLLLDAAAAFRVPIESVPFIGDKVSDVEAAEAAGARPIFIGKEGGLPGNPAVETYPDLDTAVRHLLDECGDS